MFDHADLAAQARINRRLRWAPRLSVIGSGRRAVIQGLFRIAQFGSARRLRRMGLIIETQRIETAQGTTRLRIIRPSGSPRGLVIDYHGGAWALGTAGMDDVLNGAIASACEMAVASIDYRLALPRPIAALQDECEAATIAILSRVEFAGLPAFVTGESAGAHLALDTLVRLKRRPELLARIQGALLHYGAYDLGGSSSARSADRDTLVLHGPSLARQMELLCPGLDESERRDPALSPLFADLSGLPPSLIVVGDIDPLRDDSVALAAGLSTAGNRTELLLLPNAPHGVIHMRGSYAEKVREYGRGWLFRNLESQPQARF